MRTKTENFSHMVFILFAASLALATLSHQREKMNESERDMTTLGTFLHSNSPDAFVIYFRKRSSRSVKALPLVARGTGVFEIDGANFSGTHTLLSHRFHDARELRLASRQVLIVVVSDDPAFLATFAEWSLKSRLLVWSTRLLIFTHLQLTRVHHLHKALSFTSSLLLTPDGGQAKQNRLRLSVVLPYSEPGSDPLSVATWTEEGGLVLYSHLPLFPEKFDKFIRQAHVSVAMEQSHQHKAVMEDDPSSPGKKLLRFKGYLVTVLDFLAQGINITYTFMRPPDGSFGNKQRNGTVTGMVGQVFREEADIGLGLFAMNPGRTEVIEFTLPMLIGSLKVFAGRKSPQVDPWGFILPLAPLVWAATVTSLVAVSTAIFLYYILFSQKADVEKVINKTLHNTGILFQQCMEYKHESVWWERLVLGLWMLMTLVLAKSYAGNLMSLLAVRHVPQPFQSLQDVLDATHVSMIWHKDSSPAQYLSDATSGIFYEVKKTQTEGRLQFLHIAEYQFALGDVRAGRKVIVDFDLVTDSYNRKHFSLTGSCPYYLGREPAAIQSLGMISQKDNPILLALNKRILSMNEAGLFRLWFQQARPNATACASTPTKITVSAPFSFRSIWAMFVLLVGGHSLSLFLLCLEILLARHCLSPNHIY